MEHLSSVMEQQAKIDKKIRKGIVVVVVVVSGYRKDIYN
jgi:hypothetical protein